MSYMVYMYTFPNGKIYIGATHLSLSERRDCGYNHNKRLKAAIKEAGWANIKKTILADGLSSEEAFAEEERMIKKYRSTEDGVGYNISLGGKSTFRGLKHTEDYKKRMSSKYLGRSFSNETLKKMKLSHEHERKQVVLIDENRLFESLGEAADYVCGYKTNISRACSTGKKYKGFYWRFAEERG